MTSNTNAVSGGGGNRRVPVALVVGLVAVLVVVLVGVGAYVYLNGGKPAARATSPLDQALQGIKEDGTYSVDTALAVFAAAFGPLPGVPTPPQDSSYRSGTLAILMVVQHWTELTDEQRAAIRAYIGPSSASAVPAAFSAGQLSDYQAIANADVADIEAHLGRKLGIPVTVVLGDKVEIGAWAWSAGNWGDVPKGSPATKCTTTIPPDTAADRSRDQYMRWVLLHEMWHCFEYTMVGESSLQLAWITEGEASFVAEAITGGQGAPPPEFDHWRNYVEHPEKPLYSRAYDAVGFYPQLVHNSIDAWKVLQPMVQAGNNNAALQASGGAAPSFADKWGSSWFRDGVPSDDWEMNDGYGIPPTAYHAGPASMQITDDGTPGTFSAPPNAGGIAEIHTTAFVTEFQVVGAGRVADPGNGGIDAVVRSGALDLCTSPSGTCACPPGSTYTGEEPPRAGQFLKAAVTGEPFNLSVMNVDGISKDEWCGAKLTPQPTGGGVGKGPPCTAGCGGSNGDPHLRTIDGSRYDLQAAGEFVLLRSADGAIEIQGRQEPSGSVSINTAVAARVNGHRVAFYVSTQGTPTVRVDGNGIESGFAATDLGAGAKLTDYPRGYELDFPDGTTLWALSVGHWGINALVKPSNALRANGVGLIGYVSSNSTFRVPPLPDGTVLSAPTNHDDRYQKLYGQLAPAWRVTAQTTLFDYDEGKTTDSYTVADFPPKTSPLSIEDVDPAQLAGARQTCGSITDSDLADQCAFDIAVTNDPGYETLYVVSDGLETQGTASLSQPAPTPPPSVPTPVPSGGPLPSGIDFVLDHIGGVGPKWVLGADGTLYVIVAEQPAPFAEATYELLAVDPATGSILKRAASAAPGMLAWAAGSVWAGEFNRPEIGKCQVARLDSASLAVLATVPTICGDELFSVITSVGDAVWFVDTTGAAADGTGSHLRRIDPATSAVDSSPSGSISLPLTPQFVTITGSGTLFRSTFAGLILGDRQHGLYRLDAASGSIDPLGTPGIGGSWFPAADGVWTVTDTGEAGGQGSVASFFNGGDHPSRTLSYDGYMASANDDAIFVDFQEETSAEELVRYPIDGSAPAIASTGGFVANSFGGETNLGYLDETISPLVFGESFAVKIWVAPTTSEDTLSQLLVQRIALP